MWLWLTLFFVGHGHCLPILRLLFLLTFFWSCRICHPHLHNLMHDHIFIALLLMQLISNLSVLSQLLSCSCDEWPIVSRDCWRGKSWCLSSQHADKCKQNCYENEYHERHCRDKKKQNKKAATCVNMNEWATSKSALEMSGIGGLIRGHGPGTKHVIPRKLTPWERYHTVK